MVKAAVFLALVVTSAGLVFAGVETDIPKTTLALCGAAITPLFVITIVS
jgi:hypothetical protein